MANHPHPTPVPPTRINPGSKEEDALSGSQPGYRPPPPIPNKQMAAPQSHVGMSPGSPYPSSSSKSPIIANPSHSQLSQVNIPSSQHNLNGGQRAPSNENLLIAIPTTSLAEAQRNAGIVHSHDGASHSLPNGSTSSTAAIKDKGLLSKISSELYSLIFLI